jgi:hypothetical protein
VRAAREEGFENGRAALAAVRDGGVLGEREQLGHGGLVVSLAQPLELALRVESRRRAPELHVGRYEVLRGAEIAATRSSKQARERRIFRRVAGGEWRRGHAARGAG